MGFTNIMRHECHPKLKTFSFFQNWYCCVQNWTRPFLSDAIMFDATSIVILNAPNASKSQWYLYLLLFFKKYFASYLFRVILLLILYLVTTWKNKTDIHYLNISIRFRMRMIQSWIWNLSFLLTFCKHLSLTRKKM